MGVIRKAFSVITVVIFLMIVTTFAVEAQTSTPQNTVSNDNLAKLVHIRQQALKQTGDNIDILSTFQFNIVHGAICIDDIDNINDDLADHIAKIIVLNNLKTKSANLEIENWTVTNLKNEIGFLLDDLPMKKKRLQIDATRICGAVPIIVKRAQLSQSLLEEVERILSRLNY